MARIPPYEAGRPIEEVARSVGLDPATVIKLASNESPIPPFPEVIEAIAAAAAGSNRYPDNDWYLLAEAVAERLEIEPDHLMFGGGTSELLRVASLAVGGEATSAVYPWPSFIIYRMGSVLAGSTADRGSSHARLSARSRRHGRGRVGATPRLSSSATPTTRPGPIVRPSDVTRFVDSRARENAGRSRRGLLRVRHRSRLSARRSTSL